MPAEPHPTLRRRQLGAELRRLREDRELTIDAAAAHLSCSSSKISRLETGISAPRARDVAALLDLYEVPDEDRARLLDVTRGVREPDWWHRYTDAVPRWFERFMAAESSATTWECFEAQLVPGLLQTRDYAFAVMRAANTALDDAEIDRRVELRMERQNRLTGDNALALWAVLDEAVLRRQVGGPAVMRAQLEHLAAAARRPNITIQILPYTVGAHPALGFSFKVLGFDGLNGGEVVHVEQLNSAVYLERDADLRRYKLTMNRLRAFALDPERSLDLIVQAAEDLP
ncbi:helix-turn-helix domain-containing protein [Frankia sp. CNm7]|uniref:Helix-turn-helix domain-containing protein n=1 Tax=Frankia nepalensis TaxID=1836974 RepID=A0A937RMS4_9ACTN|nr:helix-turn-helix transcriptional regulator [Frankia nepalensis]MBL7498294.1 helix-turn-helix domain-containing protein [Frankia nepalensis]MBL7509114.1 helix-turn-helix domain-containing protein [Frankia nepalensis]MBL7520801.1 helix-turn-helix domain-containing protein [Frankia nepalensis]MBL7630159.1 helix-turn-helix domain-containing protein [Frankia nepalensis]